MKRETAELHKEVEKENLAQFIIDHSIEIENYKLLLLQNYIAYTVTESKIASLLPTFRSAKYVQIAKDLRNLSVQPKLPPELTFDLSGPAEAYGAAYVVLGSGLGGLIISKHLPKCHALKGLPLANFFSRNNDNLEQWIGFKNEIENISFSNEDETLVIKKAKETFLFFADVFRNRSLLESSNTECSTLSR